MTGGWLGRGRAMRVFVVSALLLVMALQFVRGVAATSSTWDEPHHLFDGYTVWTRHDYRLNPEVPPLVKLAAALPLLGRQWMVPKDQGRSEPKEAFLDGRAFVFSNGVDRTLKPARLVCMGFALALGLLIYLCAGEMFGAGAGLFALALFIFDPNFLAHGALVTTDVGSACCFLAAMYAFYRYCKRPSWARLLLAGAAAGVLLAAKFTGVFIFPMLLLTGFLEWAISRDRHNRRNRKALWRQLGAVAAIGLCAWVVLWGFYGFRYKAAPNGLELHTPLKAYLAQMYDRKDAQRLRILARFHVLPEAYLWGLENTKNTEFEDTSYFWGRVYRHGNRAYFPVAILVKSTLPLLLLMCCVPFVLRRSGKVRALGFLLIPAAVYLAISMQSDMDIGVRHLLPVYGLMYVLAGGVAVSLSARDRRWAIALGGLLCWQIVTSVRAAPGYMAYGNEAWGGPSQVHRYLSDANTDWGQELKSVKAYLDEHHIADCWFAYFPDGAIEPADYGVPCKRLPTTNTLWMDLPTHVPPVIEGTVLLSDGDLEGIEFGDGVLNPYDGFRGLKTLASIENGVNVYTGRFVVPLAAAVVMAHDAGNLEQSGRRDEALQEAQAAVRLAPGSVWTQTALGDVLAADGERGQALEQYGIALKEAETVRPDLQAGTATALQGKMERLRAKR